MSIFGFLATKDLSKEALIAAGNQTGMETLKITFQFTPYLILAPGIVLVFAVLLKARHGNLRRLLFSGFGD